MQLAVSPTSPYMSAGDQLRLTVDAERMGYTAAWLAEVAGPEGFSLAGATAAATRRLDIGVAVVAAITRTPALLAMGAATVSQLAGGRRFILGVGSSSQLIVEDWHGRAFDPPLGLVRETVEAVRAALDGQRDYDGEHVSMARFRLGTTPAGPVPIFVAALGPKMLQLAGAVGDGVCLNLMPPEAVPRQLAEIETGAKRAGRELSADFGVMARFHVYVEDDRDAARAVMRAGFGPYFAQPVYNRYLAWCGFATEAERIASAFAAGDRPGVAEAMSDELVDAVTLAGPLGVIKERLGLFAELGIGVAALNILTADRSEAARVLEALLEK